MNIEINAFSLYRTSVLFIKSSICSLLWPRFSSSTEQSSSRLMRRHRRRRRKPKASNMDRVRQHRNCKWTAEFLFQFVFQLRLDCSSHTFPQTFPCFCSQSSSFSSITDSTMSLNIITVTLNMGKWKGHNTAKYQGAQLLDDVELKNIYRKYMNITDFVTYWCRS